MVPGLHREDFFITSGNGRLYISAVIRQAPWPDERGAPIARGSRSCFRRIVLLPPDVDPDFAEAGYQDGILHICLFKTPYPGKAGSGHIVVY